MRREPVVAAVLALACVTALAWVPLPVSAHVNDVRGDPQVTPDGTVLVETAYVADDAWLAVYGDENGSRGELLGVRRLDGAGFRTDFPVTVDDEHWRDWASGEDRRVHVALHNDDGAGGFDPESDEVLTFFGRTATDQFVIERGPAAYVGSRAFAPQTIDDETVTVRRATLPDDGFLVVRNVTDPGGESEAAAEPVGATALDAGAHRNVTVELNESSFEGRGDRVRVAFTLYRDDGDDRFDGGDDPVRAGSAAVTTFVVLNRTGGDGGAAPPADGEGATATGTGEDESLVRTATAAASATPTPAAGGARPAASGSETRTDGQPGFGPLAGLAALVAGIAGAAARRRT